MSTNSWILRPRGKPNPNADLRLICFPYAGGSATTYMDWIKWLPENIEVIGIQPPGRASRIFEPAFKEMDKLIADLIVNISDSLRKPYVVFGHSLGSRVAFELMNQCKKHRLRLPSHFIASGSRGPQFRCAKTDIYDLPDNEFLQELENLNGTPKEILKNKEIMEICLPLLRADFELADNYYFSEKCIFDLPVSIFNGETDSDITKEQLNGWSEFFTITANKHTFHGDHFFVESNKQNVVLRVNQILQNELVNLDREKDVVLPMA